MKQKMVRKHIFMQDHTYKTSFPIDDYKVYVWYGKEIDDKRVELVYTKHIVKNDKDYFVILDYGVYDL